jgi:hypothetical protein
MVHQGLSRNVCTLGANEAWARAATPHGKNEIVMKMTSLERDERMKITIGAVVIEPKKQCKL